MKRNRDVLNQICMYDLLCRIDDNINNMLKEETVCILEAVTGKDEPCRAKTCQECLRVWLNERSE